MPGWPGKMCSNYTHVRHDLQSIFSARFNVKEITMIPRISIVFVCLSSVAVAVFVSLLPDIWTNVFGKIGSHLQLGGARNEPFSIIAICSPAQDELDTFKEFKTSIEQSFKSNLLEKEGESSGESLLSGESLAAVHQARQQLAREAPRPEKAGRLYRHALALTPRQPDLLNEYGEFLERYARDVRAADHHYCRALAARPSHAAALFNRQRARPLVAAAEQRDWAHLSAKRDALGRVPDSHRGLRRMKRDDYVRHLQETAALEGNTFTLAETRALLETRMAIGGRSLAEHNEILGLEAALSFINESLSSRRRPWAVDDVLDIHRRVLGHVDPLGAGRLRLTQVYVGSHVPPPAARLPELLDEFIAWLNSGRAATLAARHPVELAARAHYRLVHIHPFYDGNGRTARLLMNYILMQAGYPPVSVRMADRQHYYRHLEAANGGDVRPFVRFIARCTDRTLDEYLSAVSDDPAVAAVLAASQPIDGDTIVVGGPPTELQRPPTPAAADWDSQDSDGDDAMEAEP